MAYKKSVRGKGSVISRGVFHSFSIDPRRPRARQNLLDENSPAENEQLSPIIVNFRLADFTVSPGRLTAGSPRMYELSACPDDPY